MIISKTRISLIAALSLAFVSLPCAIAGDAAGKSGKDMFSSIDADRDGKVTKAEHAAAAQKKFSEADLDRDGQLIAAELAAMHPKRDMDRERSGSAATPGKTETAKTEKSAKTWMSSEEMIKKYDKNNDGKLSASEHAAASEAKFASLDTNNDGSLSQAECEAGEKMKH